MRAGIILMLLSLASNTLVAGEVKSSPEVIAHGRAVFLENCIACHGEKGDGNGVAAKAISGAKPRNFTTGYFRRGSKPEEIFHTISEGSEGTVMPSWKDAIPEADRWALVYFVKSLKITPTDKSK